MKKKILKLNRLPRSSGRPRNDKIRIAIAMSGGVDSSVAAKMLKDQGYDVVGFMMKLWSDPSYCSSSSGCNSRDRENACCDAQGVLDAKKVADQLGIPFYLVNAKEIFKKEVTDYFINEYKNLRTPNPCVVCNEKIKFGWLLDFAKKTGCDYLATGHYALIENSKDGQFRLLKGKDDNKDQSYFLHRFTQDQLSHIIFPVGGYDKQEVRAMAKEWNLPVFEKRESQEICFIHDKDFREFLKRNIPAKYFTPGDIVNNEGNVLGRHEGLINYTIGQRKGIDQLSVVSCQLSEKKPLYVIGPDIKRNELIVGEDAEVYRNQMEIGDVHFIQNNESRIMNNDKLHVKIRYRHAAVPCKAIIHNSKYIIHFNEPQRAITPGQSAVFYDGDEVLGGGIIIS